MEMQKLFEGIYEIQRELKEMRHGLGELKTEVTTLKQEIKDFKQEVRERFDSVDASLEVLAKRNFETERDVHRLKSIVGIK